MREPEEIGGAFMEHECHQVWIASRNNNGESIDLETFRMLRLQPFLELP
jgi:hypothetical protein